MLLNCGVGEDSWESLGLQGDPTSPSLKEISPGCSLEGLMLKLELQYFGQLIRRADSLEKTLMLRKIEGRRRRGWQRIRWLDGITDSMDMGLGGLQELMMGGRPGMLLFMGSQRVGHDWATEVDITISFYRCQNMAKDMKSSGQRHITLKVALGSSPSLSALSPHPVPGNGRLEFVDAVSLDSGCRQPSWGLALLPVCRPPSGSISPDGNDLFRSPH